jgi:DNA-binding winged helix-turn-helix (wHTH) protein
MLYLFEDYALDTDRRELMKADQPIAVQPQVFDVLAFLIAKRDRVVTKDELIEAVWDGRVVSESTLTSRINAARSALGDSGEDQRLIRTASRKRFRFIGAVREPASKEALAPPPLSGVLPPPFAPAPNGKPSRLSIVVLPFANLGGNPEYEAFVDGVTESLTTDLSRIRGSFVVARHTAFTYKGKAIDLKQIGRELGVRLRWREASLGAATGCGLTRSSSTPRPARISGLIDSTNRLRISSRRRTRSSPGSRGSCTRRLCRPKRGAPNDRRTRIQWTTIFAAMPVSTGATIRRTLRAPRLSFRRRRGSIPTKDGFRGYTSGCDQFPCRERGGALGRS